LQSGGNFYNSFITVFKIFNLSLIRAMDSFAYETPKGKNSIEGGYLLEKHIFGTSL
jgi:hypothetical protein